MKSFKFLTVLILVSAFSIAGLSFCPELNASPMAKSKYSVVKIIDHEGSIDFVILGSDIVKDLKNEVNSNYKEAKKEWAAAKKKWVETYGKEISFLKPAPLKPYFKVLAKGFENKSQANVEKEALKAQGPFCVVQVSVGAQKQSPEIITKDEVKVQQFQLAMEHFEQTKEWLEAKADFEKENSGATFDKACPQLAKIKVLKGSLKTMEKANAYLAKCQRH